MVQQGRVRRQTGLRVLLVYYEPQASGQTTHVLSLVQGLDPRRFDLTVVLPECLPLAAAELQRHGARVVALPLRKVAWSPHAVTGFVRLIREWRPDVIHIHSQEAGLVARPLARLAGPQPILYTPQTIDLRRARWYWLYMGFERALAHITGTLISVNEADRQRLMCWGIPSGKIVTIPNGIHLAGLKVTADVGDLRHSLELDPERPLVLQVGRLSAQKDPVAFVEGAALVVQERPDAQFALIGDGPLKGQVAARIRELGTGKARAPFGLARACLAVHARRRCRDPDLPLGGRALCPAGGHGLLPACGGHRGQWLPGDRHRRPDRLSRAPWRTGCLGQGRSQAAGRSSSGGCHGPPGPQARGIATFLEPR